MILLDTTVLVTYLRTPSAAVRAVLESGQVAVCGVTRAELLHGARSPKDTAALIAMMNSFSQVPTDQTIWDELGLNLSSLRSSGVTVPFPDALIATIAIREGCEIWSYDAHFRDIARVLSSLQLFAGPTP